MDLHQDKVAFPVRLAYSRAGLIFGLVKKKSIVFITAFNTAQENSFLSIKSVMAFLAIDTAIWSSLEGLTNTTISFNMWLISSDFTGFLETDISTFVYTEKE